MTLAFDLSVANDLLTVLSVDHVLEQFVAVDKNRQITLK